MQIKGRRLAAFGLIVCLLLLCFGAAADGMHTEVANDLLDVEVRLGYDRSITYGKAIPVRVTIRNNGEDLEGVLAMNTYANTQQYDRYETEIFVPAGGERTVVLAVTVQAYQPVFTAEILQDGKVVCAVNESPADVINPSAMMVGVLSTRPRNLSILTIRQDNDTLNRYEYWETIALTPETLPDDPELLDSFGMIVLDDTDPALLTEKQQKALKNWVKEGHILVCGGGTAAPRNLAFLGDMVNLKAEDFIVSDCVHEALESFVGRKNTGHNPEIALARITGEEPLAQDAKGNGLVWKLTAGTGRIYVLAWEAGDSALNSEVLMNMFYQQMLVDNDPDLYNRMLYTQGKDDALYSPGEDNPVQVHNTLPVAAAIVGAAALIGLALWIVLNRHGASKWMWAGIPLLALAAAALITLLSGSSMMNAPVASVAVNMVQATDGTLTYYTSVTAASPKAGIHRYSMDGENLEVRTWDDEYWGYEDEDSKPQEPGKLRVVRYSGERQEAASNAASPWEETQLSAIRAADESVDIRAEIWMEIDGLHGTVTNGSAMSLKEGAVMCIWGFAGIPALAPGESADFAMIAEDAPDPYTPVFKDGRMVRNASASMYQVVTQRWFGTNDYRDGTWESMMIGMTNSAAEKLARAANPNSVYRDTAVFVYSAEPEGTSVAAIYADGKEIEAKSVVPLLTVAVEYRMVGKTGVVYHAPGMDTAVRCEVDEDWLPAGDMQENRYGQGSYNSYYTPLNEWPTFRFSPEDLNRTQVTSLVIGLEQWYVNEAKAYALNVKKQEWEEIKLNSPLSNPEKYIDGDGNLYVQFRPASGDDTYTDIPAPTLTLEGRVKDAET